LVNYGTNGIEMKIVFLLLVAAVALTIVGCNKSSNNNASGNTNSTNKAPLPPNADPIKDTARMNYEESCGVCHKIDGTGGPVTVKGEKLKVPSLKEGHALRHSDAEFADQIAEGGDGMPGFKDKFTPAQIKDIVTYIRQAFQGGGSRK
jgi:mono/diheme cytochrome c family protein